MMVVGVEMYHNDFASGFKTLTGGGLTSQAPAGGAFAQAASVAAKVKAPKAKPPSVAAAKGRETGSNKGPTQRHWR